MNLSGVIIILILISLYYTIEIPINTKKLINKTNLEKDGFIIWEINIDNELNPQQKKKQIEDFVLKRIPKGYMFINYLYYIQGCSLTTFHRDVTSNQQTFNTKYPTYTAVLYEYDGDFVSICPNSHKHYPFTFSLPININGRKNTLIVFNADMVHAGMINKNGNNRKVLQLKIVHKEDKDKLQHLEHTNIIKSNDIKLNSINEMILRKLSYQTLFITNSLFRPLIMEKKKDGILQKIQNIIPINFYINEN